MIKVFSTEHLKNVFADADKYEGFRNLMFDVANNREIFDEEENRKISNAEANEKIRKVVYEILGINENSSKKDRKRAMKRHGLELFEVIEEVIDIKLASGFRESEFFNNFVEMRNLAEGDRPEFWTEDKTVLAIAKISGDHHDFDCRIRIA